MANLFPVGIGGSGTAGQVVPVDGEIETTFADSPAITVVIESDEITYTITCDPE